MECGILRAVQDKSRKDTQNGTRSTVHGMWTDSSFEVRAWSMIHGQGAQNA